MKKWILLLVLFFYFCATEAQNTFVVGADTLTDRVVTTNLHVPWELIWGADNYIWMTERDGVISRVDPVTGNKNVILQLADVEEVQESGLLGMCLHPNFADTPQVFIVYTYNHAVLGTTEKVMRYTYTGGLLTNPVKLIDSIEGANIHNGSRLLISADRKLFISTGDAATGSRAQDTNLVNGKILRINLDGSIPADNPYANKPIWSIGHRNAQGLIIANGVMYSSEHGPTSDDEFNIIEKKRNYGWPTVAGFCNTAPEITFCNANNVKEPLAAWTPTLAVAGIAYYNHPAISLWQHSVLMTTLKAEKLVQLKLNAIGDSVLSKTDFLKNEYGRLRNICVSPYGSIFISSSNTDAYGTPGATDDRIIELRNLKYVPLKTGYLEKKAHITLFPSPANDMLYIHSDIAMKSVQVTDMTGKNICQESVSDEYTFSSHVFSFAKGMYLLSVTLADNSTHVLKWMKE